MKITTITAKEDLVELVNSIGFLPFFRSRIPGFSLEEHASPEIWYWGSEDGNRWDAWDWKGEILRAKSLVYGKFFEGKAGFISLEFFPDFCNYRRDGYDFDARYDDGLAKYRDKQLMDYMDRHGAALTREIKTALHYGKDGNKGFETLVTRLQMQTYLVPVDYVYSRSKSGEIYGWGNCLYDTSEHYWGDELCRSAYERAPKVSFQRIKEHLEKVLPEASPKAIEKLLG